MMNKIFRFLIAVFMLVSPSVHYAQSSVEIEDKMNEIKLNENMIYGEYSNDNKDIAYNFALSELLTSANELRAKKGLEMIKEPDLHPFIKELSYANGTRHFVLVYTPISQIFSLTGNPQTDIVPDNPKPKGETTPSDSIVYVAPLSNDILETLCNQDNWIEIKGFLTSFKKQGKIKETGFCTSHTEVPVDAYSILIDEMYGILSILSPKNMSNRINYRTNQPDSETNYSNCKVIVWYR